MLGFVGRSRKKPDGACAVRSDVRRSGGRRRRVRDSRRPFLRSLVEYCSMLSLQEQTLTSDRTKPDGRSRAFGNVQNVKSTDFPIFEIARKSFPEHTISGKRQTPGHSALRSLSISPSSIRAQRTEAKCISLPFPEPSVFCVVQGCHSFEERPSGLPSNCSAQRCSMAW